VWVPQEPHSQHKWMLHKVVADGRAKSFKVRRMFWLWTITQQGETNHWCTTQCHCCHHQGPEDLEEGECLFHSQMWVRVLHCISLSIVGVKRTSSQQSSLSGWACWQHHTCSHTPLGGSTKGKIFASVNRVACPIASSPSQTRYCVILILLNFVIFC